MCTKEAQSVNWFGTDMYEVALRTWHFHALTLCERCRGCYTYGIGHGSAVVFAFYAPKGLGCDGSSHYSCLTGPQFAKYVAVLKEWATSLRFSDCIIRRVPFSGSMLGILYNFGGMGFLVFVQKYPFSS